MAKAAKTPEGHAMKPAPTPNLDAKLVAFHTAIRTSSYVGIKYWKENHDPALQLDGTLALVSGFAYSLDDVWLTLAASDNRLRKTAIPVQDVLDLQIYGATPVDAEKLKELAGEPENQH